VGQNRRHDGKGNVYASIKPPRGLQDHERHQSSRSLRRRRSGPEGHKLVWRYVDETILTWNGMEHRWYVRSSLRCPLPCCGGSGSREPSYSPLNERG